MVYTEFYKQLAAFRKACGLTQAEMAAKLEVSRSTYSNYEAGKRTPDLWMLIKIADKLNCSLDELAGRDTAMSNTEHPCPMVVRETGSGYRTSTGHKSMSGNPSAIQKVKFDHYTEHSIEKPKHPNSVERRRYRREKKGLGKGLAIGEQNFRKLREMGGYYVDKTMLVEQFLDSYENVVLIIRPRRFGKTLNMSMMAEFLDCTKDAEKIFEGTAIAQTETWEDRNQYPVVYLSFLNVKGDVEKGFWGWLVNVLLAEYERYRFAWENERVSETCRKSVEQLLEVLWEIKSGDIQKKYDITGAIQLLCQVLEEYFEQKVFLLIDEYDTPFIAANVGGYFEEVRGVLAQLLSSALKGNPFLDKAFLTGIQRVAKENIFSGLNNLLVSTVNDAEYAQYFGFTEEETAELLNYYHLELTEKVRQMYDGYHIGDVDLYNPWSICMYALRKRLDPYWINTSENSMIRNAMDRCGEDFREDYEQLIEMGTVTTKVELESSFYEEASTASLWGLLINAGMVTVKEKTDRGMCKIRIPNHEVGRAFEDLTAHHLGVSGSKLSQLGDTLCLEKLDVFADVYRRILLELPSYHDLKDENSYHMMVLGMCSCLYGEYEIKSNRESGKGRSDLILKNLTGKYAHYILEFKYTKEESQNLTGLAEEAIRQVKVKRYDAGMKGKIFYIGLAHRGKESEVVWEEV
ncbi:MAG: AAA family ATPase [Clostridium sp.]|nr:AAA family ATPase [Clostridium sp.]MDU7705708.1 AAA family ATPase [Clostridium sp.]